VQTLRATAAVYHFPYLFAFLLIFGRGHIPKALGMPEMDGLAARRRLRQLVPKLPMALFSIDTSSHLENAAQAKRRSSGIFENTVESTPVVAGSSAG
jgi:CheY-like chemotaxis protein